MMCRKEWEYVWMDTDSSCRTVKKETAAVNCISTPATCRTSCTITNYKNLESEAEMYWKNIQIFTFTFRINMQQLGLTTKFAVKLFSLNSNLLQTINFLDISWYIMNLVRNKKVLIISFVTLNFINAMCGFF